MVDLTDSQLNTLTTAYAMGYYERPRQTTLKDIAREMGVSAGTVHSHLQQAQNSILAAYVEGELTEPMQVSYG